MERIEKVMRIALLLLLGLVLIAGYKAKGEAEKYRQANLRRCEQGIYSPCDIRCRGFFDVILNSDGCDK